MEPPAGVERIAHVLAFTGDSRRTITVRSTPARVRCWRQGGTGIGHPWRVHLPLRRAWRATSDTADLWVDQVLVLLAQCPE